MFGRSRTRTSSSTTATVSMTPARTVTLERGAGAAVDLAPLRADASKVSLSKKADKAGVSLSKRGLGGVRAEAVLVLDHSGSMYGDYASGVVQEVVERALGFSLQIDKDGKIPVIPFDSSVRSTVTVDTNNYSTIVNDSIWNERTMGSTNMSAAFDSVIEMAKTTNSPMFVVCVCDGSPDSQAETTRAVCELSRYPVFIKFLSVRPVDYLQRLDDLDDSQRLLDNVDCKDVPNPGQMTDLEFSEAMVDEWDSWIDAAIKAGVLN